MALIVSGLVWAACLASSVCPAQRHAFYLDGSEWFGDYRVARECAAAAVTYRPGLVEAKDACYPPICYALVGWLPRDVMRGGAFFSLLGATAFLLALAVFAHRATDGDVGAAALWVAGVALSAPMVLAVTVSNQVLLAAAGVLVFLAWHDAPSRTRRLAALAALAVASALKLTPAVFAALLVKRRDWKGLAVCAAAGAALVFVPFAWAGGFEGLRDLLANLKLQSDYYSLRTTWGVVALDRSLRIALTGGFGSLASTTYVVSRTATVLLGVLCLYRFFRVPGRTEEVVLLAAAISFLPAPAQPYTGLYLAPAMLLAVKAPRLACEPLLWLAVFCVLQIPLGNGSANHALAGLAHLALVGLWLLPPRRRAGGTPASRVHSQMGAKEGNAGFDKAGVFRLCEAPEPEAEPETRKAAR